MVGNRQLEPVSESIGLDQEAPILLRTVYSECRNSYRLIDLKSGKIGMRCISTGLSPLDLGIGAMA